MGNKIPTERQVLRCIYDMHEEAYPGEVPGVKDVLMNIDVRAVAKRLNCKAELLFGYLYYHLENKYGYKTGETSRAAFFTKLPGGKHAVNFPFVAAILAGLDAEHERYQWSLILSWIAIALSVGSIIAQILTVIAEGKS